MADPSKRRLPIVGSGSTADAPARDTPARLEPSPGGKRKLPVVASGPDEEGEERPPWHWVALGTVAIFITWLPLAALANLLLRLILERVAGAPPSVQAAIVGLNLLAFVLASVAGGFLVGRFGGRAGQREATASGVVVAMLAWMLSVTKDAPAGVLGWAVLLVVVVTIGGAASRAGGRAGLRARSRGTPPG